MISSHSLVSIPHEFPLFSIIYERYGMHSEIDVDDLLDHLYEYKSFQEWGILKSELELDLRSCDKSIDVILNTILSNYIKVNYPGKAIWGDKNIGNIAYLNKIKQVFPGAKIIHIVRDVRDVALSLKDRKWLYYQFRNRKRKYIKHLRGGVETWKMSLNFIRQFKSSYPESIIECRYEDLVLKPKITIKILVDFLGIPFERKMLEFSNEATKSISNRKLFTNHKNLNKPLLNDQVFKFEDRLSVREQNLIYHLTKNEMHRYNYNQAVYFEPTRFDKVMFNLKYNLTAFIYFIIISMYHPYRKFRDRIKLK
jgi:hypothetical protein